MKLSDSIYWIYVVLRLFLSPSLLVLPILCRHDNTHTVNRVLNLLTYLLTSCISGSHDHSSDYYTAFMPYSVSVFSYYSTGC